METDVLIVGGKPSIRKTSIEESRLYSYFAYYSLIYITIIKSIL